MLTRLTLSLVLILGGWAVVSPSAQASCEVQTGTVTYANGAFLGGDLCDANGNKKVTTTAGGASAATATSTAAAPTYAEGSTTSPLSLDLSGNLRITPGTLLAGEDIDNDLLQTSGGATRQLTVVGGPAVAATDATSTTWILPVPSPMITFQAILTCTGTCTQVHNIYGSAINSAVTASSKLLCTLVLSDTTTASASCVIETPWSYYFDVTSGSGGTTPLSTLYAMF